MTGVILSNVNVLYNFWDLWIRHMSATARSVVYEFYNSVSNFPNLKIKR